MRYIHTFRKLIVYFLHLLLWKGVYNGVTAE